MKGYIKIKDCYINIEHIVSVAQDGDSVYIYLSNRDVLCPLITIDELFDMIERARAADNE